MERYSQPVIEDDPNQGLSSRQAAAIREAGVVDERRVSTNENRIVFVAYLLDTYSRGITRHSGRNTFVQRDPAVERHCQLEMNERPF